MGLVTLDRLLINAAKQSAADEIRWMEIKVIEQTRKTCLEKITTQFCH